MNMKKMNEIPDLSIIVAMAQNNAIGKDNDLLWHISDDLKRFKSLTLGHPVIMGRNTWRSLPRRPLPKRRNIVLTHDESFNDAGAEVAHSINGVFNMLADEEQSFVIGGASIYRQFLPFVKRMYVTWVWSDFVGDVYFPIIDMSFFEMVEEGERMVDVETGLEYSYACYERRHNCAVDKCLFVKL